MPLELVAVLRGSRLNFQKPKGPVVTVTVPQREVSATNASSSDPEPFFALDTRIPSPRQVQCAQERLRV
jgi:hypothetical protein